MQSATFPIAILVTIQRDENSKGKIVELLWKKEKIPANIILSLSDCLFPTLTFNLKVQKNLRRGLYDCKKGYQAMEKVKNGEALHSNVFTVTKLPVMSSILQTFSNAVIFVWEMKSLKCNFETFNIQLASCFTWQMMSKN